MSKSNLSRPFTRSQSQLQAENQIQNPQNTQPSGSRLNRSIQSTKEFIKGFLPSKVLLREDPTKTIKSKIRKSISLKFQDH